MSGDEINVLSADVWWGDGYENSPSLTFVLDRAPRWEVYDKRPGGGRGQLSSEQEAAIGRPAPAKTIPGWSVYWSHDDGFVTFFTWGGKPDDGFGGWRRTVRLLDGSEEEVVGGWHVSPGVAVEAGLSWTIDAAYSVHGEPGRISCFVTIERFEAEVARLLPDVEVVGAIVGWRGRPSKAEFMKVERGRRDALRDVLRARYADDSWHGGDWYRRATDDERAELKCRPYSALSPTGEAEAPGIRMRSSRP